ncbi:zinc finger protein 41-like [Spea bombifrons]|uniref:zinc finger protein 41-like n=1 Tax=Spea bombifrons TaxID=233779 RepID=UPI002349190B|nr:zinc finger protein 41-like [Spea bombifrons]
MLGVVVHISQMECLPISRKTTIPRSLCTAQPPPVANRFQRSLSTPSFPMNSPPPVFRGLKIPKCVDEQRKLIAQKPCVLMDEWGSDSSDDSDVKQGDMQESIKSGDVTVCFSVEELDSLEDRQKEPNGNVKTKIHQRPNLVGYLYVKPEIVPRIHRGEELCVISDLYTKKRRHRICNSSGNNIINKRDSSSLPWREEQRVIPLRCNKVKEIDKKNGPEETVLYQKGSSTSDDYTPANGEQQETSESCINICTKTYACSVCGDTFKEHSLFLIHQSTHVGQKSLINKRGRNYSSTSYQGVQTEDNPYACPERRRHIPHISKPMANRKIQTEAKSFICKECGKSFTQKASLIIHQRTHTGERPHMCKVCGKSFISGSYLVMHQRVHTGERPYVCNECGKRFISSSNLIIHQRVHTGEKPYLCTECGKCFGHSSHLVRHQKVHTGERPFTCAECGKSFSRSSHLVRHQTIHMRNPASQVV